MESFQPSLCEASILVFVYSPFMLCEFSSWTEKQMNYARAIYLVGRSHRQIAYSESERAEIICFILYMMSINKEIASCVRFENYLGTFAMQSDVCLGKNLQRICKFLKYRPLTEDETMACNKLLACVWSGRANNSYTQKILDGLLNVMVSGIDTGLLKVIINGIVAEKPEEFGDLYVEVGGIDIGNLQVNVDGVYPVESGNLNVGIRGIETGFLKINTRGITRSQDSMFGNILMTINGIETGRVKVHINGIVDKQKDIGNLFVHTGGIKTGFVKVNVDGLPEKSPDNTDGQLLMTVSGIETGTLEVLIDDVI